MAGHGPWGVDYESGWRGVDYGVWIMSVDGGIWTVVCGQQCVGVVACGS